MFRKGARSMSQRLRVLVLGAVGLDWEVGGIAPDALSASNGSSGVNQLVQAMAGFDGGGAADDLKAVTMSADTSQQQFLTTPQHA